MSNVFDPAAFENMVIEDANETKTTPVPDGEYMAMVGDVTIKSVKTKDRGDVPVLQVMYDISDDSGDLAKELNREEIRVRHDLWLDVNDNGGLAFGPNQNVGLGRLREACGMNKPGQQFSFKMLEGQGPLKIVVITDPNPQTGDVYNKVTRVTAWAD